jgi:hypothetical protein
LFCRIQSDPIETLTLVERDTLRLLQLDTLIAIELDRNSHSLAGDFEPTDEAERIETGQSTLIRGP